MKEFNLTESEGIYYILNVINIADLVCLSFFKVFPGQNVSYFKKQPLLLLIFIFHF